MKSTFLLGGPTLLPNGQVVEASLLLSEGKVLYVRPGRDPGADWLVEGTIVPGLIDLQVNGAYGYDFTSDSASVRPVAERLPSTGVTSFVPTLITSPLENYPRQLAALHQALQEFPTPAARVMGVHLEGPYLNPLRKGAHDPADLRPVDPEEIDTWASDPLVSIVTLAPELPWALEAVRRLSERGIVVSAGHSDATYDQALAGFRAGIRWGTHLFNAMSALNHRDPGLPGALLTSEVPCGLIADGVHVHPAGVVLAWRAKGPDGLTLVTDCMSAMGMPPGRYALAGQEVSVTTKDARLADGTLAGSILTMDAALRNVIAFTGCGLADAVRMLSTTPARLLGQAHRLGSIQEGWPADLVLLTPDLHVQATFVNGELAYQTNGCK